MKKYLTKEPAHWICFLLLYRKGIHVTLPAAHNGLFYANVRVERRIFLLLLYNKLYNSIILYEKMHADRRVSIQLDMLYSYSAHYDQGFLGNPKNPWFHIRQMQEFSKLRCYSSIRACKCSKLPTHYIPISANELAVFLTECWTANQISTEYCICNIGNFQYNGRWFQC